MRAIGMMAMFYIQSWKLLHREASSAVEVYCFGPQNTENTKFISGLMDRITQIGCPPLADISQQGISCTFVCHKFRHVVLCGQPLH